MYTVPATLLHFEVHTLSSKRLKKCCLRNINTRGRVLWSAISILSNWHFGNAPGMQPRLKMTSSRSWLSLSYKPPHHEDIVRWKIWLCCSYLETGRRVNFSKWAEKCGFICWQMQLMVLGMCSTDTSLPLSHCARITYSPPPAQKYTLQALTKDKHQSVWSTNCIVLAHCLQDNEFNCWFTYFL